MTAIKAPSEMIRVAILVESLTVPEWVRWTVAQIEAEEGFYLVPVLLQSGSTECSSRRGEGTYRLYERLDRAVFGPASALRAVDLTPLVSARTEQAALDSVDIVLSFLPAERTRWHGARTRHGLWAMVPMDDGGSSGSASRFWELHNGEGVTGTSIVALTDGSRRVLARDSVRADALSLTRTRNLAAWGAAHLVLRTLRLLRRDGAPPPPRNDPVNEQHTPTAATTIGHVARTAIRGVAAKSRTIWSRDEWFVAARPRAERIEPDWIPGLEATHTYTFDSHYECLDGRRHVGRLQTMIGQAFTRAHAPPPRGTRFPRFRKPAAIVPSSTPASAQSVVYGLERPLSPAVYTQYVCGRPVLVERR